MSHAGSQFKYYMPRKWLGTGRCRILVEIDGVDTCVEIAGAVGVSPIFESKEAMFKFYKDDCEYMEIHSGEEIKEREEEAREERVGKREGCKKKGGTTCRKKGCKNAGRATESDGDARTS